MRQWKVAISLAIVGAIAAPFVFGTWKHGSDQWVLWSEWVPLTLEKRKEVEQELEFAKQRIEQASPRELQQRRDGPLLESNLFLLEFMAEQAAERLREGGEWVTRLAVPKVWAKNLAVALAVFVTLFGLVMVLPAIVRRYWRWLKT